MILWKGLLGQPQNPRDGLIWLKRAADKADENNQHALHELVSTYRFPNFNLHGLTLNRVFYMKVKATT
jgi:TPR repeat protein